MLFCNKQENVLYLSFTSLANFHISPRRLYIIKYKLLWNDDELDSSKSCCVLSVLRQQPNGENVIRRDKLNKEKTLRIMREFFKSLRCFFLIYLFIFRVIQKKNGDWAKWLFEYINRATAVVVFSLPSLCIITNI